VFFILAKFGFPVITRMVEKRNDHIAGSLRAAEEAQKKLAGLAEEQAALIEKTRLEQGRLIKEASETRDAIVAQAKEQASREAAAMIEHAKTEIAAERESAIRDIRSQVASISVEVAEKIVRKDLGDAGSQQALLDRLVDEASKARLS
jgi:F-type H+-transporting ATPase subunit b